MINIGSKREVFWDDYLIDRTKTDTVTRLHSPVQRECVLEYGTEMGGNVASSYNVVLADGDIYRMYTRVSPKLPGYDGNVAYAESRDGIHWEKPDLGIVEYGGSKNNNLLFDFPNRPEIDGFDSFRPFIDESPDCPPEERIKAIGNFGTFGSPLSLQLFTSHDGIHFEYKAPLKIKGAFDSVNTVIWNKQTGTYQAFVRDFHPAGDPTYSIWTRDIRFTESDTLFPKGGWPIPQPLCYNCGSDWQMYINSIMKYYRADHLYIGFPSRYIQRREWTENYDELCGPEARKERMKKDPRHGLAVSDTMFMMSRDGLNWTRYPEAFIRPGPEHPTNWVYGSVYFSNGIVETESSHPGCEKEISFYCCENRWFDRPGQLYRYSIRRDGFVSQFAPYPEANLVTKPFIFEGKDLFVNISTSAYGHLTFKIKDTDGHEITSCETFGDSTDKRVHFNGDLASFSGKPVVMSINMCDADLFSFRFAI